MRYLLNLFSESNFLSDFSKEFYHWLAVCHNEAQQRHNTNSIHIIPTVYLILFMLFLKYFV